VRRFARGTVCGSDNYEIEFRTKICLKTSARAQMGKVVIDAVFDILVLRTKFSLYAKRCKNRQLLESNRA